RGAVALARASQTIQRLCASVFCNNWMSLELRCKAPLFFEHVSDAMQGVDRAACTSDFETTPHPRDQNFDRVGGHNLAQAVKPVLKRSLWDNLGFAAHQQFQSAELPRSKANRGIVDGHLTRRDVEMQVANSEHRAKRPARPSQEGPQPSRQLLHSKRLENVVIGASVQARDPILNAIAGGQDEDGCAGVASAHFPQHLDAIAIWQTEVEDDSRIRDCFHGTEAVRRAGEEINTKSKIA